MKRAIALIELIFAIVVIGITLISVPNLIKTTTKASSQAITQEAVSNAVSHMNLILSSFWDEQATNPKYSNPILYVKGGDSQLNEATDTNGNLLGRRVGSPKTTSRRFATDISGNKLKATEPINFGFDNNETEPDDVDDFNNLTRNLVNIENTSATQGDYKDTTLTLSSSVTYISDNANYNQTTINFNPFGINSAQSTNIKEITVTLTSPNDPDKTIILKGFSCNIGSAKIKERVF
jgi:Tfp pilus assembly protein PilV